MEMTFLSKFSIVITRFIQIPAIRNFAKLNSTYDKKTLKWYFVYFLNGVSHTSKNRNKVKEPYNIMNHLIYSDFLNVCIYVITI